MMFISRLLRYSFIMLALCHAFPAWAGMAGIGNAVVEKSVLQTHLRTSYTSDDGDTGLDRRIRSRAMVDYGFTDDFALGFYLQGDNRKGEGQELEAAILDARFELTHPSTHGYYSGFRLRYTYKDGDKKPDNAHIRLIFGVPVADWDFRINQIFAYEVGEDAQGGLGVDTRLQATYGYLPRHRIGVETFSDFGYGSRKSSFDDQNHTAGPVLVGWFTDKLAYETGYRVGLSDAAADHTFKFFLIRRF